MVWGSNRGLFANECAEDTCCRETRMQRMQRLQGMQDAVYRGNRVQGAVYRMQEVWCVEGAGCRAMRQ